MTSRKRTIPPPMSRMAMFSSNFTRAPVEASVVPAPDDVVAAEPPTAPPLEPDAVPAPSTPEPPARVVADGSPVRVGPPGSLEDVVVEALPPGVVVDEPVAVDEVVVESGTVVVVVVVVLVVLVVLVEVVVVDELVPVDAWVQLPLESKVTRSAQ